MIFILEDQKSCITGYEELEYFMVKIDNKDRINKDTEITALLDDVLQNIQICKIKNNYKYI